MDQKKYNLTIFTGNNDVHQSDEVMRKSKVDKLVAQAQTFPSISYFQKSKL